MSLRFITSFVLAFVVASSGAIDDFAARNVTTAKPADKSAAEKKKMEAAKKNSKVMEGKVAELKKQEAAIKKEAEGHTTEAKKADEKIKSLKKASKCRAPPPGVPATHVDPKANVKKAQAAADDEAGKRNKKEHDAVVAHAKDKALKTSKALLAEEHAALKGKLLKEVLKVAEAEATKYAPQIAKKEVGKLHRKIAASVKQELFVMVKKDATVVARVLAMKEVQDQADKSTKVKALVASVAKDAAKYFTHKFSKTEVTKLAADEAKKHVKARVAKHTEIEIGKAQADAKKKVADAGKKVAQKTKKVVAKAKMIAVKPAPAAPVAPIAKPKTNTSMIAESSDEDPYAWAK